MDQLLPPEVFEEAPANFIRERRMSYLMVNAIARRVRQLQTGDHPTVLPPDGNRLDQIRITQQEYFEGKLEITPRKITLADILPELNAEGYDIDEVGHDAPAIEPEFDGGKFGEE